MLKMYCNNIESPEITCDGMILKIECAELSDSAKNVAFTELRETPENIENGLKSLKKLLEGETNLAVPKDNDLWLMSFLRPCKYYPESALNMIKNYYNYRKKYSHICQDLKLNTVKKIMHTMAGSTLPKRDQHGRRINVILSGKYWNPSIISKEYFIKSFIVQTEFARLEPETQVTGMVIILDMIGLTFAQSLHNTLNYLRSITDFLQDGMALRLKGYHIVNQPKIFDIVFSMAKQFLREKLSSRIYFHGSNMASLHAHISRDCLPECYGGTLKMQPSYGKELYQLFENYEKDFDKFQQYGYRV